MFTKKKIAFVGNYGSGKTEIALHTAFSLRAQGERVTLVDMDIVNPYFRTAEHADALKEKGIRLIAPIFAITTVDIPAIPPEMYGALENPDGFTLMDVGGDDTGAVVLGRFYPRLREEEAEIWFVMNACRPFTSDAASVLELMDRIEARGRVRVTGLLNNTNTGDASTLEELLQGHEQALRVAEKRGIPLAVSGQKEILDLFTQWEGPRVVFTRRTRPAWM